jgi:hypothetical protein
VDIDLSALCSSLQALVAIRLARPQEATHRQISRSCIGYPRCAWRLSRFRTSSTSSAESPDTSIALSSTPQSTPASRVAPDYRRLLIEPGDINTGTDTFVTRSSATNPGGSDGGSALFVYQHDTWAVGDTILILPDSAAATTTLNTTVSALGTIITGDRPQPWPVGTGGTVVSGTSRDGSKAVTVLLFTEGRAVVRLEFGSAPGDPMPPQVVTDVGNKQEIAIRPGCRADRGCPGSAPAASPPIQLGNGDHDRHPRAFHKHTVTRRTTP